MQPTRHYIVLKAHALFRLACSWAALTTFVFMAQAAVFAIGTLPRHYDPTPALSSALIVAEFVACAFCVAELALRVAARQSWRALLHDTWVVIAAGTLLPLPLYLVR